MIKYYIGMVLAGQLALGPIVARAQTGTITGIVRVSGTVVIDAEVRLRELGLRTKVDGTGRFLLEGVSQGEYILEGESPRWGRGAQSVTVRSEETTELVLELEAVFHLGELLVTTAPGAVRQDRAYQATTVVTSRDLLKLGAMSLGETLSKQPGLSSTYFGPGSSRPIIRGLSGDRVRILQNGLSLGDASGTSPDHAVSVESRMADQIEVIRGPATLLYGSSAVGGVVNVMDASIARDLPPEKMSGFFEGLNGTVANERTGSLGLTSKIGNIVFSGSGVLRRSGDFNIPGFATRDIKLRDEHEVPGILANSSVKGSSGNLGISLVGLRGYAGMSVSDQWSNYGVPGHGHHVENHAEDDHGESEGVRIDLDRSRIGFEGGLRFQDSKLQNLTLSVARNDYLHEELIKEVAATTFLNKSSEGRLESEYFLGGKVRGSLGASFSSRDFTVTGEEMFVPATDTRSRALFGYENISLTEDLGLQVGSRIEQQNVETRLAASNAKTFQTFSSSLSFNWLALQNISFSVSGSRSSKIPTAEELFSNGPHFATGSFELGDPNLRIEKSTSVDLTINVNSKRFHASTSLYDTDFSDYIYLAYDTYDRDHDLPRYQYSQANAHFHGFEMEAEFDVYQGDMVLGTPNLSLGIMTDAVIGKLLDHDIEDVLYVPRLPPYRIGGSISYSRGLFSSDLALRYSGRQGKVSPMEEITDAFTMVDASVTYRLFSGAIFHDISLMVNNVTDSEARLHTSFQKDLVPLPGREVKLVYRMNF